MKTEVLKKKVIEQPKAIELSKPIEKKVLVKPKQPQSPEKKEVKKEISRPKKDET